MGKIRSYELPNKNLGLEITYGGLEAPFGGVDLSAPPAYIDPRCFASSDGFIIANNKLVVASLQPLSLPLTLWNNVVGVTFLAFGTFYNSTNGQLNYALGYTAVRFGTAGVSATGTNYTYYMTSWIPGTPATSWTDVLPVTIYDAGSIVGTASLTLDCVASGASSTSGGTGASCTITAVDSGGFITAVSITGGTGYVVNEYLEIVQNGTFNALAQVATVDGGGGILTTTLVSGGNGYGYNVGAASLTVVSNSSTKLTINGPGGTNTYNVNPMTTTFDRQHVAISMRDAINGAGFNDPNVTAALTIDGYGIILTSKISGTSGNSITVQDVSTNTDPTLPPPFYFTCRTARNLEGGQLTSTFQAPTTITGSASTVDVGGTLYIANLGPMILKYSGPGLFTTSTLYNGVDVLGKYAGSLIGLRLKPQLGTILQNQDMIMAWTAGAQLDEWAPLTTQGFVTGAGFAQLADIGDFLSGLIVANGTAFILRSQGISYATGTGNATLPFTINHIGLGERGEGCPVPQLVCQYDQTGVYAGGSNLYQISGQISAIGQKIAPVFFSELSATAQFNPGNLVSAQACAVLMGGAEFPLVAMNIPYPNFSGGGGGISLEGVKSYVFNPANGTWTVFTYASGAGAHAIQKVILGPISSLNTFAASDLYNQTYPGYAFQQVLAGVPDVPSFFILAEGVANVNSISSQAQVTFPQEEVLFGREVTIDSLYVALNANVSENTYVDFYINNTLYATLLLTAAVYNSVEPTVNPIENQVFSTTYGAGAFTAKSPQLTVKIRSFADTGTAQVRFSKLMVLASFDPNQRPT